MSFGAFGFRLTDSRGAGFQCSSLLQIGQEAMKMACLLLSFPKPRGTIGQIYACVNGVFDYPLKVQAIGQQPRLYVSFPLTLAAAIGLEPGEAVQWELLDQGELQLVRPSVPPTTTRRRLS